jgi:hypothetical protein
MRADDPRHGSNAGYIQHCLQKVDSCQPCRTAHNEHKRAVRARKQREGLDRFRIDPTGTRRRIRALIRMGWRYTDMDRWLGNRAPSTHNINRSDTMHVHTDTAAAVKRMYDALSMQLGPSERNRAVAARRGWPSPLAWDDDTIDDPKARPAGVRGSGRPHRHEVDEVAVLRAIRGDRSIALTTAERAEVSRRLRAAGWSFAAIEAHTGLKADRYLEVAA